MGYNQILSHQCFLRFPFLLRTHLRIRSYLSGSLPGQFCSAGVRFWTVKATLAIHVPTSIVLDKLWKGDCAADTRGHLRKGSGSTGLLNIPDHLIKTPECRNIKVKEPQVADSAALLMPVTFVSTKRICSPRGDLLYVSSYIAFFPHTSPLPFLYLCNFTEERKELVNCEESENVTRAVYILNPLGSLVFHPTLLKTATFS